MRGFAQHSRQHGPRYSLCRFRHGDPYHSHAEGVPFYILYVTMSDFRRSDTCNVWMPGGARVHEPRTTGCNACCRKREVAIAHRTKEEGGALTGRLPRLLAAGIFHHRSTGVYNILKPEGVDHRLP